MTDERGAAHSDTDPHSDDKTDGAPKKRRFALGCGLTFLIGCGGLVVLTVICFAAAAYWAIKPGTQHPTITAVPHDALAAIHTNDLAVDPGTSALVRELYNELQRRNLEESSDQVPAFLRKMQEMQLNQSRPEQMLPRSATLAFVPPPPGERVALVATVNLAVAPRGIALVLAMAIKNQPTYGKAVHRDSTIHSTTEFAFARYDGTLLFSSSEDLIREALDRMHGEGSSPPSDIQEPLTTLAHQGDFATVLTPGAPLFDNVLQYLTSPELSLEDLTAAIDQIAIAADIVSVDETNARLELRIIGVEHATRIEAAIDSLLGRLSEGAAEHGISVHGERQPSSDTIVLELTATGIEAALPSIADAVFNSSRDN